MNKEEHIRNAATCLQQESPVFFSSVLGPGWLGLASSEKMAAAFYRMAGLHQQRLFVLLAEERDIYRYVAAPDPALLFYLDEQTGPVAVELSGWLGLPALLNETLPPVALLLSPDLFVRHLVRRLSQPLLWLSAKQGYMPEVCCRIPPETEPLITRPLTVISWEQGNPIQREP